MSKYKEKEQDVLELARKRDREAATYWKENWDLAEDDLNFENGKQWPDQVQTERELEQRPCLVNNVIPTYVRQVTGDQRQNRPRIKVSPVSSIRVPSSTNGENDELKISNQSGNKEYSLAEAFTGIIKGIEYDSDADTAYDSAFEAAVKSGIGYLRIITDYEGDDSFDQTCKIKSIDNQFSVKIDPNAREKDKSDMNWCLIDDTMPKDAFEKLYPDCTSEPLSDSSTQEWFLEDQVRVSEYFVRESIIKEMLLLSDGRVVESKEVAPVLDELKKQGITVEMTRKVRSHKVIWRKITGNEVLEGPIEIPCSTIPVVPVFGDSTTIKKKTIYRSLFRQSKDAQRMANYWDSAATENVALAPKAPFIAEAEQIEGYEEMWRSANTKNHAVLVYNRTSPSDPGPQRAQGANIPAAEITLAMNSSDKIKATMGMFDASMGAQGNESSGKAIIARQRQGDRGSFVFIDNLSKAIARVGKILVEMFPKVCDTERTVRLKFANDDEDYVTINQQVLDEQTGEWFKIHDIGSFKWGVAVTTGPSYATQRMEAAESMIRFAQAVPNSAAIMSDLIALNMDWPGADSIAERLKKSLPGNLLSAGERKDMEKDAPQPEGPTPEQQVQQAEFQARTAEAEADKLKAQISIQIEQIKLKEAELEMQRGIREDAEDIDEKQKVRELVAEAIAEMTAQQQARMG